MRCRKKSTPARPYACRFSNFNRWTKPSVGPLLPLNDSPARRARAALRTPGTTARHAFPPGPCLTGVGIDDASLVRPPDGQSGTGAAAMPARILG